MAIMGIPIAVMAIHIMDTVDMVDMVMDTALIGKDS